ncbi:DUF2770 family protein [Dryocola sp. BD613]
MQRLIHCLSENVRKNPILNPILWALLAVIDIAYIYF